MELFLTNKPTPLNQELLSFLDQYLPELVSAKCHINFNLVTSKNISEYQDKGIKNFPAIIYNKNLVVGLTNVKNMLKQIVESQSKQPKDAKSMDNYWTNLIEQGDEDDSAENKKIEESKKKAMEAMQDRSQKFKKPTKGNQMSFTPSNMDKVPISSDEDYSLISKSGSSDNKTNDSMKSIKTAFKTMEKNGENAADDELMTKFFENHMNENSF